MLAGVIRAADESDFDVGFEVIRRVWPRAVGSVAGWRHEFRAEPEEAQRRYWAAEEDGRVVGWATAFVDYESAGRDPARVGPGVAPDGIELLPLTGLDPQLVFALDAEASVDIPNEDNDDLRFEQWHADYWAHPDVDLESSVAAVAGGRPVSYSLLHAGGDRGMSGMTGTRRSHRGRGLAGLVKRATLANAAARGIRLAYTHNDETNAAMLRVNAKLGYRPVGSLLGWTRG
jgi:GNAT superfamily N-acetyltransferase